MWSYNFQRKLRNRRRYNVWDTRVSNTILIFGPAAINASNGVSYPKKWKKENNFFAVILIKNVMLRKKYRKTT